MSWTNRKADGEQAMRTVKGSGKTGGKTRWEASGWPVRLSMQDPPKRGNSFLNHGISRFRRAIRFGYILFRQFPWRFLRAAGLRH